jgi:hypothetical protein
MIAFESPEGQQLRALGTSLSATMALWFAALTAGDDAWCAWAQDRLADLNDTPEVLALRFIQSASDQDMTRARQMWAILGTWPTETAHSAILKAARELRASLPF